MVSVNGLNALNVFNSSGDKKVWVPGPGTGTALGTINFPALPQTAGRSEYARYADEQDDQRQHAVCHPGRHAVTERGEFHRARDMTACSFLGNASGGTANYAPFTTGSLTLKSSWVCPKQYLALCIKAAFSRNITRVKVASIVERGVPSAVLPPAAPSYEIAIFAMGISRLPGRTKDALGGVVPWRVVPWSVDYLPGHRWRCQHRKKDCGNANQSEFRHPYLLLVSGNTSNQVWVGCDGGFR